MDDNLTAFNKCIGKTIALVELCDDILCLKFADGVSLHVFDDARYCCETRYMCTDDNLAEFSGAKLLSIEVKYPDAERGEFGEHEIAFLEIGTGFGSFTLATHNEHNGYYGGFDIRTALV